MLGFDITQYLIRQIQAAQTLDDLRIAMEESTEALGFRYFAIAHHASACRSASNTVRLHSYPSNWVEMYEESVMAAQDPVRKACQVTSVGFPWGLIPSMIDITDIGRRTLSLGRDYGIADGFTVPATIPGEPSGSCTFATTEGRPIAQEVFPMAQVVGAFAFNRARHLSLYPRANRDAPATLTARQRECLIWIARGKSDWEISRIMGVSEETVARHVKAARGRYKVQKRTLLAVRALADGTLSFDDVLGH